MTEPRVVAVVQKNKAEEVRVALTEYGGHPLVDVRVYADIDRDDGERQPTKRGVSLARAKLPELIEALQLAECEGRSG